MEIRPYGKDNSAAPWQAPQGLPLRPEIMMLDRLVLLGCGPSNIGRVFVTDGMRPGEVVIDLEEIVVPQDLEGGC
jgi:hypothetical protein